jgi:hypothetical protein
MKSILLVILSVLFLTSCDNTKKEKQLQTMKFETKLKDITEVSPDTMYVRTLEILADKQNEPNSGFSNWTPEMIQEQAAYTYHSTSEDLIKLVVDMLVYKKMIGHGEVSVSELESFVDRVRNNKGDKIDNMIVQTFDLAIQYEQTYLELKPNGLF